MPVTRAELDMALRVVTAASGSAGDWTASRNHYGSFIRARVDPAQPVTPKKTDAQASFRYLATRWQDDLTPAMRAGWATYARNVPLRNALGDLHHVGGFHHFVRVNVVRSYAQYDLLSDPPTIYTLGSFTPMRFKLRNRFPDLWLAVAWNPDDPFDGEPGSFVVVYATSAYPPSITSFKPPRRYIKHLLATGYFVQSLVLGPTAFPGSHVFVRVLVNRYDGRLSAPQDVRLTVP